MIGENTNKIIGYLAATSRKLDKPLGVIVQSNSAAGKSTLMNAILDLMPEEETIRYSSMTGQSLYYLGEKDLRYKILSIAEEEGLSRASYALKLLQSEGSVSIASTGKDESSGRMVTQEYKVDGPVALFTTSTSIDIDEELENRSLILTVDESREQTRAIQDFQRFSRTREGFLAKRERKRVQTKHQNAQRLLRSLPVLNPFENELTFYDHYATARRDNEKYLCLISTVAFLRQYQKEKILLKDAGGEVECIEVEQKDVELATELSQVVFGNSLDDLPPQTRKLYQKIKEFITKKAEEFSTQPTEIRFNRREIREFSGLSNSRVHEHMQRLVDYEYLLMVSGGNGRMMTYEFIDHSQLSNSGLSQHGKLSAFNGELSGKNPIAFAPLSGWLFG